MKRRIVIAVASILLVAGGFATGLFVGHREVRWLVREWFPEGAPDANLLTLYVKTRADGTAELRYVPITQKDLSKEARRRVRDWGFGVAELSVWCEDAATFGQMRASALDPVTAAGYWKYEIRFVRNAKAYRIRVWRPSPDGLRSHEKPTELRIAADGRVTSGTLTAHHAEISQMMDSLRHDRKLGFVAGVVDPACPMGLLFDILAAAADRGLTELTLIDEYEGSK